MRNEVARSKMRMYAAGIGRHSPTRTSPAAPRADLSAKGRRNFLRNQPGGPVNGVRIRSIGHDREKMRTMRNEVATSRMRMYAAGLGRHSPRPEPERRREGTIGHVVYVKPAAVVGYR